MEYAFARNFNISRADMLDMPYAEVKYWVELLKREAIEEKAK